MPSRNWVVVAALAVVVVAAASWFNRTSPEPAPLVVNADVDPVPGTITVHISGEVVAPGLVVVADGSRIADVVAAAGGTTRRAALDQVNLAATLVDGQQVVIPGPETTGSSAGTASDGKIHINSANVTELEQLPGVGPVLAARIAAFREENGPFRSVEDLLDVSGIGEAKLSALRDSVAVP